MTRPGHPSADGTWVTVDGGGTHGRARLHPPTGQTATTTGPRLSLTTVDPATAATRILALLDALAPRVPIAAIEIGLAGGSAAAGAREVAARVAAGLPPARVAVGRDLDLVAAQLGSGPGAVLVAGTGVVVLARGDAGEVWIDGHGPIIGDRGGGTWIGLEALRRSLAARDATGVTSPLLRALATALGVPDPDADDARSHLAAALADGGGPGAARLAALAPVVFARADREAELIITDAVRELATSVDHARRRARVPGDAPFLLAGGLVDAPGVLTRLSGALGLTPRRVDPLQGWIGDRAVAVAGPESSPRVAEG